MQFSTTTTRPSAPNSSYLALSTHFRTRSPYTSQPFVLVSTMRGPYVRWNTSRLSYHWPLTAHDATVLPPPNWGSNTTRPFVCSTCTTRHPSPATECAWMEYGHRKTNHAVPSSSFENIFDLFFAFPLIMVTLYVARRSVLSLFTWYAILDPSRSGTNCAVSLVLQ